MATLFLALQCVQRSTMLQVRASTNQAPSIALLFVRRLIPFFRLCFPRRMVKQRKKSSTKWVCDQRQSVLRVHARGYRAADLRRFVEEANLARGRGTPVPVPEADWEFPAAGGHRQDEPPREKRRMDWSEYLDDTVDLDHRGRRGGWTGR
jgi:hypothetical protein